MPTKSFLVKVELTVQKISCPGVWLCSNGKVSLQICMLDSTIQTESHKPIFPVIFSEKFIFYKTFLKERRLNELQRSLTREWLCAELIQWKNCDEGVVLASFKTTLDDLLYPSSLKGLNLSGTEADLLMEPTKLFPGTISPKLELRTKTTIEETLSDSKVKCLDRIMHGHTTKTPLCKQRHSKKLHPKRVCHTVAYSRAQQKCPRSKSDSRPIFKYQRPEEDLILRTNPNKVDKDDVIRVKDVDNDENSNRKCKKDAWCYCNNSEPLHLPEDTSSSFVKCVTSKSSKGDDRCPYPCACGIRHSSILCPVCSKYDYYFLKEPRDFLAESSTNNGGSNLTLCSYCRINLDKPKQSCGCNIDCPGTRSVEKKVCFCLPEERTLNLARRLHSRLRTKIQNGAAHLENCFRDCQVCE